MPLPTVADSTAVPRLYVDDKRACQSMVDCPDSAQSSLGGGGPWFLTSSWLYAQSGFPAREMACEVVGRSRQSGRQRLRAGGGPGLAGGDGRVEGLAAGDDGVQPAQQGRGAGGAGLPAGQLGAGAGGQVGVAGGEDLVVRQRAPGGSPGSDP